jgi:hypothetical protein
MRKIKISTPNSLVSNFTSKFQIDTKKDKSSTNAGSLLEITKQRAQASSVNISPRLSRVRRAHTRTSSNSISPEQAAIVVRDYILPLFKFEKRMTQTKKRTETFGLKNKKENTQDGGILNDLRLIEKLNVELIKMKETNKNIDEELKISNQNKDLYASEYKNVNDKLLNAEINLNFLNYTHTQTIKKTSQELFCSYLIKDQYLKYKSLYEDQMSRYTSLEKILEKEKTKNNTLKNIATQLEHFNNLLVMENDIMGEKLKGLYVSLQFLVRSYNFPSKIAQEIKILLETSSKIKNKIAETLDYASLLTKEKKELESVVKELGENNLGLKQKKEKYIKLLKEKNAKLELDLKNTTLDYEKQRAEFQNLRQKFSVLQDEHQKVRFKLKNLKINFSEDLSEEKYCKNCHEVFTESNNLNWSCKNHASEMFSDIYWCCGQKGKDAPGCMTSHHISAEDLDDKKEDQRKKNIQFCSVINI